LARACGAHGFTAREPGELSDALRSAFAIDGPAIVDAVVAADELPNFPHLDLDVVGRVAVVKAKEALLVLTGRVIPTSRHLDSVPFGNPPAMARTRDGRSVASTIRSPA